MPAALMLEFAGGHRASASILGYDRDDVLCAAIPGSPTGPATAWIAGAEGTGALRFVTCVRPYEGGTRVPTAWLGPTGRSRLRALLGVDDGAPPIAVRGRGSIQVVRSDEVSIRAALRADGVLELPGVDVSPGDKLLVEVRDGDRRRLLPGRVRSVAGRVARVAIAA